MVGTTLKKQGTLLNLRTYEPNQNRSTDLTGLTVEEISESVCNDHLNIFITDTVSQMIRNMVKKGIKRLKRNNSVDLDFYENGINQDFLNRFFDNFEIEDCSKEILVCITELQKL